MDASLTITTPDSPQRREVELEPTDIRVGRSSRCDIRIPTRSVSGHHLTLHHEDSRWFIVDEHSTNGTVVDGRALRPGERRALEAGDVIELTDVRLEFDRPRGDNLLTLQETGTLARQLVGDMLLDATDDDLARIEVSGPDIERVEPLEDSLTRAFAGRDEDCLLTLPQLDAPRLIELSRVRDGFGVRAVDVTGRDDVRLNGSRLTSRVALSDGDVIEAGPYSLEFFDPLESILLELDDGGDSPLHGASDAPSREQFSEEAGDSEPVEPDFSPGASTAETGTAEPAAPASAGLSATEWVILTVAVVLMLGAAALLLTVFDVI